MSYSFRVSSDRPHATECSRATGPSSTVTDARAAGAAQAGGVRRTAPPLAPKLRLLGQGQFCWTEDECDSKRWGAFYLHVPEGDRSPYDDDALQMLVGRRVRLVAEILAAKPLPLRHLAEWYDFEGGRIGDVVELGVGVLRVEPVAPSIGVPVDHVLALQTSRRKSRWLHHGTLGFLRAHTVAIRAERTTDPCAPSFAEAITNVTRVTVRRSGRKVELQTPFKEARLRRLFERLPVG